MLVMGVRGIACHVCRLIREVAFVDGAGSRFARRHPIAVIVVSPESAATSPPFRVARDQVLLGQVSRHAVSNLDGQLEHTHRRKGPTAAALQLVLDRCTPPALAPVIVGRQRLTG